MKSESENQAAWRTFRRAFLWTLAAAACVYSLRAEADDAAPNLPPLPTQSPPPAQPMPGFGVTVQPRVLPQPPDAGPSPVAPRPAEPPLENATDVMPAGPMPPAPMPPATNAAAPRISLPEVVPQPTVTRFPDDNWAVAIVPRTGGDVQVNGMTYQAAYAAIPYNRAEYLANPGYRHEAALELMFGQLRPKTVVSEYKPQVVPTPYFSVYKPYRYSQTELQNYLNIRPAWGSPYSWNFPLTPYYPRYPSYPMLY